MQVDVVGVMEVFVEQFIMLLVLEMGIDFENKIIEKFNYYLGYYDYYYNGSGLVVGDFNNDGFIDLFFCGNYVDNMLYLNEGGLKFIDVIKQVGIILINKWLIGVMLVDINEDGWLDIYVSNFGLINDGQKLANQLYVNNQDGIFIEQVEVYGIVDVFCIIQFFFFDIDNDGDFDFIVMNYLLCNWEGNVVKWLFIFVVFDFEI